MKAGRCTTGQMNITSAAGTNPALIVTGTAGQATDILQITNSGGSPQANVSAYGCPANRLAWDVASGRLTLVSGSPTYVYDVTGATSVLYSPFGGTGQILLWNSTYSYFEVVPFTEMTLSLSGLAANTNYDVFVVNGNNGTCSLGQIAWTNDTTRATTLLASGYIYPTGAEQQRYVGTIRTTATTGQCEDSALRRYVWNIYNQIPKLFYCSYNPGTDWAFTASTSTFRPTNNSATNVRVDMVIGRAAMVQATLNVLCIGFSGGQAGIGISFDQTSGWYYVNELALNGSNAYMTTIYTRYQNYISAGHHWLIGLDYIGTTSNNTATFWGPATIQGWYYV